MTDPLIDDVKALLHKEKGDERILKQICRACENNEVISNYDRNYVVKPHLGMTGEITLRGQVMPIGGVKEKVLAAHRNGLKTVILPKRRADDIDDVPDEIKDAMKFVYVETVDDVLKSALESDYGNGKKKPTTKKAKTNVKSASRRG